MSFALLVGIIAILYICIKLNVHDYHWPVDYNPTLLQNISQNLTIFDKVQVLFKANVGHDALDKLNNHHFKMLLMDIEMSEIDGIDTNRQIKELFSEIKIMMLSVLDCEDKIYGP